MRTTGGTGRCSKTKLPRPSFNSVSAASASRAFIGGYIENESTRTLKTLVSRLGNARQGPLVPQLRQAATGPQGYFSRSLKAMWPFPRAWTKANQTGSTRSTVSCWSGPR